MGRGHELIYNGLSGLSFAIFDSLVVKHQKGSTPECNYSRKISKKS